MEWWPVRTTRRVTAQRKFAQGAFMPQTPVSGATAAQVAAAAATFAVPATFATPAAAAPAERRDALLLNVDRQNIFYNNMPVHQFLDVICFKSKASSLDSHSHVRPIVLVEKLDTLNETTSLDRVKPPARITKKRFKRKRRVPASVTKRHVMNLRSRSERNNLVKYSPPPFTVKRKLDRVKLPDKCAEQAKRRNTRPRQDDGSDVTASDFSLDDNRPLKYFAKCSTPNVNKAIIAASPAETPESSEMPPPSLVPLPSTRVLQSPTVDSVNQELMDYTATLKLKDPGSRVLILEREIRALQLEEKAEEAKAAAARAQEEAKTQAIARIVNTCLNIRPQETAKEPASEAAREAAKEVVREAAKVVAKEGARELTKEPAKKPAKTSVKAKGKGKSSQPATKAGTGAKDKPAAVSQPEAAAEVTQEPAPPTKIKPKTKHIIDAAMVQRYFDELEAGPSGLNRRAPRRRKSVLIDEMAFNLGSSSDIKDFDTMSYYSAQGIQRWMEGSTADESEKNEPSTSAQTPQMAAQDSTIDDIDDEDFVLEWEPDKCPANAWITLKNVIDAPKSDFDRRCTMCRTCERIEKLMKVSSLLKQQMRIDCSDEERKEMDDNRSWDNLCLPGSSNSRTRGESGNRTNADGTKHLYLELIPSNTHLLMKIKVKTINGKQVFSACFTPRSDLNDSNSLVLSQHEELFDHLIETLSLNLGEGPSNLVKRPTSPVNVPIANAGPAEYCIDMDDILSNHSKGTGAGGTSAIPGTSTSRRRERVKIPNAPVFYPTKEEFNDPIQYIEKIWDEVAKYGICKIVPPEGFEPPCKADDEIRFEVFNQYISRLYCRWGAAAREFCAIKMCLRAQNISFTRPPMLEGVEVNLPKLFHLVQRHGGLETVSNRKKWGKVAEDMNLMRNPFIEKKLDQIYVKYLLPYATLSEAERMDYLRRVELAWSKKHRKLLERANKPLHRKKRLLRETDSSAEETGGEDETDDIEDCIKLGANMTMAKFKKVARSAYNNFFRGKSVSTRRIEVEYWRSMMIGSEHLCVNSASIDTGAQGLGFSKNKNDQYGKHPWNLKMLSEHRSNVLRAMGPVLGVTVPTLHLGMVFSTSCWHRDPHAIAWMEYTHQGPTKIWYGMPETEDKNFRRAMECLSPTSCQNKRLWLSSDIAMIPPYLLLERNVRMYRVEQNPGEFVLVLPNAYTCSISTGFTVSESAYFATEQWLDSILAVFEEIRDSCEPTMFSLEKLLKDLVDDPRTTQSMLRKIRPAVEQLFGQELRNRKLLRQRGVREGTMEDEPQKGKKQKASSSSSPTWNVREHDECEVCRSTLFLSKVKHIPGKNSVVCLEHALALLDRGNSSEADIDLELRCAFSDQQLQDTLDIIEQRLDDG